MGSCGGCWPQVEDLKLQLQQLESKLSTAQSALRQVSIRSPAKSQQFTASLSSLDAFSPSQTLPPSQNTHPTKKQRAESSQALPIQDSAVSQDLGAAEFGSSMPNSPATQLHTGNDQNAASSSGDNFFHCASIHSAHPGPLLVISHFSCCHVTSGIGLLPQ